MPCPSAEKQSSRAAELSFKPSRCFSQHSPTPSSTLAIHILSDRSLVPGAYPDPCSTLRSCQTQAPFLLRVPSFLKGILDLVRRVSLWYGRRWVSGMGHGKFIVKKHLKHEQSRCGATSKIQDGWAFSLQQTSLDSLCYCARNAALNSEIAGLGWQRLWMSLQRRKERHQSETEEERVKKRGRGGKKREKKCLCFDMGGMRRDRRICFERFSYDFI